MIRVVIVPPDSDAYVQEIENELQVMQDVVGGYIEMTRLTQGINIVCNEDGVAQQLPRNRHLPWLVGTVFLISSEVAGDGEMVGLKKSTAENWAYCLNCGVLAE